MKIPHQDYKTAQISASKKKPMVGQGKLDLMMEMPHKIGDFEFTVHERDYHLQYWYDVKHSVIVGRANDGLIIFTKELDIWSIVI